MTRRVTSALTGLAVACSVTYAAACVQKAYDRVIVYRVDVSGIPDVKSVGLRGRSAPLSWDKDTAMRPLADSADIYELVVTHRTGSLTTEVKFTVNGAFEFEGGDNRTVRMAPAKADNDTTLYRGVFNVR
jgi:hypothetical protein